MNKEKQKKNNKDTGLKRNNNEQYYTKGEVAQKCIDLTNQHFPLDKFNIIIEPSAGTGSFINGLNNYTEKLISYDIDPKHDSIIKQDYLTTQPTQFATQLDKTNILVIGNPPFGRQSSLAKKFIRHSCLFANVIAFILPKSFKKDSMIHCFDLYFHKVFETNLDENSFIFEESEYSVPCVFQIWEKKTVPRVAQQKMVENDNYTFTKEPLSATFAFRRVGVYAGKFVFENICSLSKESHYFISSNIQINNSIKDSLNSISWNHDNTTGPKSISKQELISKLNQILIS